MRSVILVLLVGLAGCDLFVTDKASDTGFGFSTGTPDATTWEPTEGHWTGYSHPCFGNRTDAMWWDDQSTAFVGCGSTTVGYGLYTTKDGGQIWTSVADERLSGFRVSSIQRADDDGLYVAGIDTNSKDRVLRIGRNGEIGVVFQAGDQLWNSFHVGTFRRNSAGVAVAESLTGTGLVWRGGDEGAFVDGSDWPTDGSAYQILDMVLYGNAFYGVGSTIGSPPVVFLPSSTDPFAMEPVQLADWNGEMWGVAVDEGGVVAGGVNQRDNEGMVFVSSADPTDADAYRTLNVGDLVGGGTTWIRGVCRSGPLVAAVGEFSQNGHPILAVSADSGVSWQDWTDSLPDGAMALHKCTLWPSGRLAVTGQSGYLAVWSPG